MRYKALHVRAAHFGYGLCLLGVLNACGGTPADKGVSYSPTVPAYTSSSQAAAASGRILQTFAESWRGAEEFPLDAPITLGIWVGDTAHTITLSDEGGRYDEGAPTEFDWGFETDAMTLNRLNDRSLNALTAMGQASPSDPIPLKPRLPEGFNASDQIRSFYIPLTLHFWDRQWPEAIAFGEGATRTVHGANTTVFVYAEGLRSAWYQLKPGMHINADPADQVNTFDTAIIITRGQFSGRLNGADRNFQEGETVLIPGGMTHEFFADESEYGEFIILMYGEGA